MKVESKVQSTPPVKPRPVEESRRPIETPAPPAPAPDAKGPAYLGQSIDVKA